MTKNFFKRGLSREELIKTRSEYFRALLKSDHRLKHCPEIKMCPGCSEILNLAEFGSNVREKDGYQSRCRACSRELYLKRRNITPVVEKLCLKCNQHLPASNFRKNILKKDGLKDNCISCSENKINQSFSVERILTERKKKTLLLRKIFYQQKLPEGDLKLCPLCEFPKSILEFTSSTSSKDGLGSYCFAHRTTLNKKSFVSYKAISNDKLKIARKNGKITIPEACEECGISSKESNLEAHHTDYSKPLDVQWLCRSCHNTWHSKYAFFQIVADKNKNIDEIIKENCPVNYGHFKWNEDLNYVVLAAIVDKDFFIKHKDHYLDKIKAFSALNITKPPLKRKISLELIDLSEKTKEIIGVYSITHLKTGKIYYGSTSNWPRRLKEHINELSLGTDNWRLQELINLNPQIIIKFIPTKTLDKAIQEKKRLIKETSIEKQLNIHFNENSNGKDRISQVKFGNKNGINVNWTKEAKIKHSKRMKGNTYRLGLGHTEATRKKMSESRIGKKKSFLHIEKVATRRTRHNVEIDGILYLNASRAAKTLGVSRECIIKRCNSSNFPNYKRITKCL